MNLYKQQFLVLDPVIGQQASPMRLIGSFVICRSASLTDINELAISGFLVVIRGVHEIPQGNSLYIICRIPHSAEKHV